MSKFYSQEGQDRHVLNYYNNKKNGYFIEIGASDGIQLSNTYTLEQEFDWTGICVEPIPNKYELLCKNRPKSHCCNQAVFNKSDVEVTFDIANQWDVFSGISDYIIKHKNIVNKNKTQITVNTITFNDLLIKFEAPSHIDYLSLDTEGSELEILKSVDMKKYSFGIIHVEHNREEPIRSNIFDLLTNNNYSKIGGNAYDDYYKLNI